MITMRPVRRALVPSSSKAAQEISGPNYDEFQSDQEIWDLTRAQPQSILRVTMAHCDAQSLAAIGDEESPETMERARSNLEELISSALTTEIDDLVWVYEIAGPSRPGVRQIGLGGMASTSEIRSEENPGGTLVRNEGIRESKARGRARLIESTGSCIGIVNMAVEDADGRLVRELESFADSRLCDYHATDETGHEHRVWLVTDPASTQHLVDLLGEEPCAYVADGNHRSAAAGMLGLEGFLAVFFTTDRLGLAPYNRLVRDCGIGGAELMGRLAVSFDIERLDVETYSPSEIHDIGLYHEGSWHRLGPKTSAYDAENAVECIDADIVQRKIFADVFGMSDPKDAKIQFVGGNKDAAYLRARVDSDDYAYALVLAPVTMDQFVQVCQQNRFMPPKSTWFEPKIRSGLVVSLLD